MFLVRVFRCIFRLCDQADACLRNTGRPQTLNRLCGDASIIKERCQSQGPVWAFVGFALRHRFPLLDLTCIMQNPWMPIEFRIEPVSFDRGRLSPAVRAFVEPLSLTPRYTVPSFAVSADVEVHRCQKQNLKSRPGRRRWFTAPPNCRRSSSTATALNCAAKMGFWATTPTRKPSS